MRIILEPTDRIVEIVTEHGDKVPGRVWQGSTAGGIAVVCVVTRVATLAENDRAEFDATLMPVPAGRAATEAFPMRMIL